MVHGVSHIFHQSVTFLYVTDSVDHVLCTEAVQS